MKNLITILITIFLSISLEAFTLNNYGSYSFEKVNNNVYVMHGPTGRPNTLNEGYVNNVGLIVSKNGLIIIDPGGNYKVGKKILVEVEKISKKPIIAIINSDKYGKHWFANKSIVEKYPNVKIYANALMVKENREGFANYRYDVLNRLSENLNGSKEFSYPKHKIYNTREVLIDDEKFVFHIPQYSHTASDLIVEHENSQTLFLGVNLLNSCLGTFDGKSSILGNLQLLENIKHWKKFKLYVPGHGKSGNFSAAVSPFLHYLSVLKDEAQKAYDNDRQIYEIVPIVKKRLHDYKDWSGYSKKIGKHLSKVYNELIKEDLEFISAHN